MDAMWQFRYYQCELTFFNREQIRKAANVSLGTTVKVIWFDETWRDFKFNSAKPSLRHSFRNLNSNKSIGDFHERTLSSPRLKNLIRLLCTDSDMDHSV